MSKKILVQKDSGSLMQQKAKINILENGKSMRDELGKLTKVGSKIARVTPNFKFAKVSTDLLLSRNIKFSDKDSVSLTYKRNVQPYAFSERNITGTDNTKGWKCSNSSTTEKWSADQVIETNNAISKIFLGAVYDIKELASGNAVPLHYARKPLYILVDSHHFQEASVKVESPFKHEIREAINKIIRSKDRPDIAFTHGSMKQFDSFSSLLTNFSGSGHFLGFGGSHDITFESRKKSHKFYLECKQLYYTISVSNTVNEPEDFFHIKEDDPNIDDAVNRSKIDPNWVFVDSVGYGRLLYMIFECDESYEGMDIDLEQYADYWLASAKLNESVQKKIKKMNVSVKVFALGGSPLLALSLTDNSPEGIKKTINNYLKGIDDEVPISYSLCTLDMKSVGTSMFLNYQSRQCHPWPTKYKVIWDSLFCAVNDDGGDGESVKAMVRIRALDKNGKDIMDEDKINKDIIAILNNDILSKEMVLWTFSKGNEDTPLFLKEKTSRVINKSISFPMTQNREIAKIGIRADIIEYDMISNDNFMDDNINIKINEIDPDSIITLTCTEEKSVINFNFRIIPLYD